MKVIVIGGTSHVGKSSLGQALATRLGWELLSTDQFARHPGRPWRDDDSDIPADVATYFSSLSDSTLLQDVWAHYQDNVWPIARAIVSARLNNPFDPPIVIEGSAILPELVADVSDEVQSLWLVGEEHLITQRIRKQSSYDSRGAAGRSLIDTFVRRTLGFGSKLEAQLHRGACQSIRTSEDVSSEKLAGVLVNSWVDS